MDKVKIEYLFSGIEEKLLNTYSVLSKQFIGKMFKKTSKKSYSVYSVIKKQDDIKLECGNEEEVQEDFFDKLEKKSALYGFEITKAKNSVFLYFGKSYDTGTRLRQHITGKNKNGTYLAKTVSTKHKNIVEVLNKNDYFLRLHIWIFDSKDSKKITLPVLETWMIDLSFKEYDEKKASIPKEYTHWNRRSN